MSIIYIQASSFREAFLVARTLKINTSQWVHLYESRQLRGIREPLVYRLEAGARGCASFLNVLLSNKLFELEATIIDVPREEI